jgi:hypothetical protein
VVSLRGVGFTPFVVNFTQVDNATANFFHNSDLNPVPAGVFPDLTLS